MAELKSFTLAELAQITKATLVGNPSICISNVNTLEEATSEDASFLAHASYEEAMKKSKAGVICIQKNRPLVEGKNFLVSDDPSLTFQLLVELFSPLQKTVTGFLGIHPTAVIHESAKIDPSVTIGPYAVIDQGVEIGEGSLIGAHVYVGPFCKIGKNCTLHPSSLVRESCVLGNRVILQPGAVIGSCGFGYLPDAKGRFIKLAQLGNVLLEDDVEIGANATIDRARFKSTIIRRGSKIDNLVQIAHNVEIGEDNGIAAQTGIAGSSKTGNHVLLGGQVGIVGHVELGSQIMIATRGGVSKSLPHPGKYRGSPAIPIEKYNRIQGHLRKLGDYVKIIQQLQQQVAELEKKISHPIV